MTSESRNIDWILRWNWASLGSNPIVKMTPQLLHVEAKTIGLQNTQPYDWF